MRFSAWMFVGAAGLALAAYAGRAQAQDTGNEVWIGQTGETNTIAIKQQGNGNRAGGDNAALRLNQHGEHNLLSIDQYGWSNKVGAQAGDENPLGLSQVGDRNTATVEQYNNDPLGFNTIGAILQQGQPPYRGDANTLFVRQDAAGGADPATGHSVGMIVQTNSGGGAANSAEVRQSGGEGNGNTIALIRQDGQGNIFTVDQDNQSNFIGVASQEGMANKAAIRQGGGDSNSLDIFSQIGDANQASISFEGSRNFIERMWQDNTYSSAAGNRAEVVLTGEDNGGDGRGGRGEFLAPGALALSGVVQGNLVQIGDDNDARVTVSQGSLTKYGIWQEGDGNGAIVSVSASGGLQAQGNETAVFQKGIDNNFHHTVIGSRNVLAASQDGERNRAELRQEGMGNVAILSVLGNENNSVSAGGFWNSSLIVAEEAFLTPGQMTQFGLSNRAELVITGSNNLSAFRQHGDDNRLFAEIGGSGNAMTIVQSGESNTSFAMQTGSGNSLGIRQY